MVNLSASEISPDKRDCLWQSGFIREGVIWWSGLIREGVIWWSDLIREGVIWWSDLIREGVISLGNRKCKYARFFANITGKIQIIKHYQLY